MRRLFVFDPVVYGHLFRNEWPLEVEAECDDIGDVKWTDSLEMKTAHEDKTQWAEE